MPDAAIATAHAIAAQTLKPWWQSKKMWLTAIAFAVAAYGAFTGKDLPPDQVVEHIASIAGIISTLLVPIAGLFIHDTATRTIALNLISTLATLNKPDAAAPAAKG